MLFFRRLVRFAPLAAFGLACAGDPNQGVTVNVTISGNGNGVFNGEDGGVSGSTGQGGQSGQSATDGAAAGSTGGGGQSGQTPRDGAAFMEGSVVDAPSITCQPDGPCFGSIAIDAAVNHCPTIRAEGNMIDVHTWQYTIFWNDPDGDPLTFHWTATGGQLSNPDASETTYTCGPSGVQTIVATVSDGMCMDTWTVMATCP